MRNNIEHAILWAIVAHQGQKDKGGEAYILHPLRVALRLSNPDERIVAVLHDVVEDSDITVNQLHDAGFSDDVVDSVDALTRRKDESYSIYIKRVALNPIAKAVKLADLADNMDPSRGCEDHKRTKMYQGALKTLGG